VCEVLHDFFQMTVCSRWPESEAMKRAMQYKIQDKSVIFFALGMSGAVL